MRHHRVVSLFIFVGLLQAGLAAASGFGLFQHGGRATGQVGAFTARGSEPSAVTYNPAAITGLPGLQLQAGLDFSNATVDYGSSTGSFSSKHIIDFPPALYLTWKAKEYGVYTRFIELAGEINSSMPHWVIGKVIEALNERKKSIKGSRCLVLGIAYKKNVDDMRESPSVELMELLTAKGASVDYSDPHVPTFPKMRKYHFDLRSVPLTPEGIAGYDLVLLATNHDKFDYPMIQKHARLIVDTRGVYLKPAENVVKA